MGLVALTALWVSRIALANPPAADEPTPPLEAQTPSQPTPAPVLPGSSAGVAPEDAALLKEIEAAGQPATPPATPAPAAGPSSLPRAAGVGVSNIFNPAMTVNGLLLGTFTSKRKPTADEPRTGLAIQEIEVRLLANVDPDFAANITFAFPDIESVEIEEGYVTPNAQPLGIQARIGKLKLPFGRENPVHTHALPFVDKSLVGRALFGEEGLSETGVELSYLFPLPWYLLVSVGGVNGDNAVELDSPNPYDLAGFAGLKNVFDLGDDATLEAGLSYAAGNNAARELAQVLDAHLVFKWRPARQAREREAIVTVEALYATKPNAALVAPVPHGRDQSLSGVYAYAQWRLGERWYAAGRFDYLGFPNGARGIGRRGALLLAFAPTEFSAIRAQANVGRQPHRRQLVYEGFLQLNFTLGAHPAHAY